MNAPRLPIRRMISKCALTIALIVSLGHSLRAAEPAAAVKQSPTPTDLKGKKVLILGQWDLTGNHQSNDIERALIGERIKAAGGELLSQRDIITMEKGKKVTQPRQDANDAQVILMGSAGVGDPPAEQDLISKFQYESRKAALKSQQDWAAQANDRGAAVYSGDEVLSALGLKDPADLAAALKAMKKAQREYVAKTLLKPLPELRFEANTIADCIDFMRDVSGLDIFVDWRALEAAGCGKDLPVTLKCHEITPGAALALMLWQSPSAKSGPIAATLQEDGLILITTVADLEKKKLQPLAFAPPADQPAEKRRVVTAQLERRIPEVKFASTDLKDTIEFMRDVSGLNIFIHWADLEAGGIATTAPVSLRLRDTKAGDSLALLLTGICNPADPIGYAPTDFGIVIARVSTLKTAGLQPRWPALRAADLVKNKTALAPVQAQLDREMPEINFNKVGLNDGIDFLRDVTGANIWVDWRSLNAAGILADAPMDLKVKNIPLQTALRQMLAAVSTPKIKLDFLIEESGLIVITTAETIKKGESIGAPRVEKDDPAPVKGR